VYLDIRDCVALQERRSRSVFIPRAFGRRSPIASIFKDEQNLILDLASKNKLVCVAAIEHPIFLSNRCRNKRNFIFLKNAVKLRLEKTRAIDKLRSRTRAFKLLQRWSQTVTAETSSPTPCEHASLTERSHCVRQALAQLTEKQRQVIEMAYDRGIS
jgi:hypothetical protein